MGALFLCCLVACLLAVRCQLLLFLLCCCSKHGTAWPKAAWLLSFLSSCLGFTNYTHLKKEKPLNQSGRGDQTRKEPWVLLWPLLAQLAASQTGLPKVSLTCELINCAPCLLFTTQPLQTTWSNSSTHVRATKSLLFSLVILSLRQPTEKLNRAAISSKSSHTLKSQQQLSHWRAFNDAFRNSFRKEEEAEEEEEEEEEVDFLMVSHRGRRHRRCHRLISY
jgi:hypothetical protein